MASASKSKPYLRALLFGVLSIGLYVGLITNQDMITENFSKGGVYAFLPVAAAFLFSFVHGTFTGDFWTVLGVEAAKKKEAK